MKRININRMVETPSNPNFRQDTKILQIVTLTPLAGLSIIVAGGSVIDTLLGRPYNDIDVWSRSQCDREQVSAFAQSICDQWPKKKRDPVPSFTVEIHDHEYAEGFRHRWTISISSPCGRVYEIQIMEICGGMHLISTHDLVATTLKRFSSCCTKFALVKSRNGNVIIHGHLEDEPQRIMQFTKLNDSPGTVRYIKKCVEKYSPYFGIENFRITTLPAQRLTWYYQNQAPLKLTTLTTRGYEYANLWGRI